MENSISKNDVIHDAIKLICDENLERLRNFVEIGNMGTGINLPKNREIALVFSAVSENSAILGRDMGPPPLLVS